MSSKRSLVSLLLASATAGCLSTEEEAFDETSAEIALQDCNLEFVADYSKLRLECTDEVYAITAYNKTPFYALTQTRGNVLEIPWLGSCAAATHYEFDTWIRPEDGTTIKIHDVWVSLPPEVCPPPPPQEPLDCFRTPQGKLICR